MTYGPRCSFGCDKNKGMIEERVERENLRRWKDEGRHGRRAIRREENTQNGTRGKVEIRLPASDEVGRESFYT